VVASGAQPAKLLAYQRPGLPRYMLPRRVHLLEAMPRRPNGKIRMDALRALCIACIPASVGRGSSTTWGR
jgi:acyl-coenzyme A synthetase/AMP-(fatty) acid ligase